MERESFEDAETAALMNEHFVCIKVDREERPDVDAIYMDAVQAMTGHGGWPLNVFLTADQQPFFGGTYWPPEPRMGTPSWRQILTAVADAWANKRPQVVEQGTKLAAHIAGSAALQPSPQPLDPRAPTCTAGRSLGSPSCGACARRRSTGRCARCAARRARSTARSTPTPKGSRASSTCGRWTSCARRWATTPTRRSRPSAPPRAG